MGIFVSKFIKWFLLSVVVFIMIGCGGGDSDQGYEVSTVIENPSTDEIVRKVDSLLENNASLEEVYNELKENDELNASKENEIVTFYINKNEYIIDYSNSAFLDDTVNTAIEENNKVQRKNKTTESLKSLNCENSNKNALFLLPYDSDFGYKLLFLENSPKNYSQSSEFTTIKSMFIDIGYCVDTVINSDVNYEIMLKVEKYNYVNIIAHSNEQSVIALRESKQRLEDTLSEKTGLGESWLYSSDLKLWAKVIVPSFFSQLDFSTKNTLFQMYACNTLEHDPSPLTKTLMGSGAYGIAGFSTQQAVVNTSYFHELFITNLLKRNTTVKFAIENTTTQLEEDINIEINSDIDTFHLQTYRTDSIGFNIDCPENRVFSNGTCIDSPFEIPTPDLTPPGATIKFSNSTLTAYFSENMQDTYFTTGDYSPARSYWLDKRTFVIEFESYIPGGTIVLQSEGFVSEQGVSMANDIFYVFPEDDVPTPTPPVPLVSNLNISDFSPSQGIVSLKFNVSPEGGTLVTLNAHCAANNSYDYLYQVRDYDATVTGDRSILFPYSAWKGETVYCKIEAVNSNGEVAPYIEDSTYISN